MSDNIMKGTPPAALLPARNYLFRVLTDHHMIEIPRKGKYKDLAPEFFKDDDGEFNILDDNGVLFMPSITKVLFALKKYPDLENNQLFIPHTFEFKEDVVVVIGQAIELTSSTEAPEEDVKEGD